MTAGLVPCLCPYHRTDPNMYVNRPPWPGLPELYPILVPDQPHKPRLVWACLPCATKLAQDGRAMRCITGERG